MVDNIVSRKTTGKLAIRYGGGPLGRALPLEKVTKRGELGQYAAAVVASSLPLSMLSYPHPCCPVEMG
jgi:hypothetical protein